MTHVATIVPAEGDLLCEGCGYTLNGLPLTGNCPECGKPIEESVGSNRVMSVWEDVPGPWSFWRTSKQIIFHPTRFYSTLATRRDAHPAFQFAKRHWVAASFLLGLAAGIHATWYSENYGTRLFHAVPGLAVLFLLMVLSYVALWGTTEIAARLTHWEASYRGLRLPLAVVRRGLYYHAAHYLPVGFIAAMTVFGYCWLVRARFLGVESAVYYLYVLCAEVIFAAAYLFKTYWIGMKNMMYANR